MRSTTTPLRARFRIALAALALGSPLLATAAHADAPPPPAAYVAALQPVVGEVSAREARALWKAGVTPDYARALAPLFATIAPDELVSLHRLHLSADEVIAYRRAGIADAATIIRLRSRQISPKMARRYGRDDFMKRPFETMNPELGPW